MANIDGFISNAAVRFSRLTDDVNVITDLMRDIRICFIALTFLVYALLIGYVIHRWSRYRRRQSAPRFQYDIQEDQNQSEYRNQTGVTDDLVSVRSDSQMGTGVNATGPQAPAVGWTAGSRNHRTAAPFMRHGRQPMNSER
ncbi:hypothetical protein M3Y94_00869400 [Aphelenchoides besseyi]|nr:hypothetical protein M3Y94_00869400 [Aphelenchoides besseyi]